MNETNKAPMTGGQRRFIAFWAAFVAVVASHWLQLSGEALTSLVAIVLGYMGQGALKEAHIAGVVGAAPQGLQPADPGADS